MINFSILCQSKHWPPRSKKINLLVKRVLNFQKDLNFKKNIDYNCNIILTNNKFIKKINSKYLKKNKGTDVLTFVSQINIKKNKIKKVCDIFFSAEIIKKDADNNDINFYDHMTHLCIHSFLHINGFMHYKLDDFKRMKKIEIKILKKIGISNPYIQN